MRCRRPARSRGAMFGNIDDAALAGRHRRHMPEMACQSGGLSENTQLKRSRFQSTFQIKSLRRAPSVDAARSCER